jgi:hypothetical protein
MIYIVYYVICLILNTAAGVNAVQRAASQGLEATLFQPCTRVLGLDILQTYQKLQIQWYKIEFNKVLKRLEIKKKINII